MDDEKEDRWLLLTLVVIDPIYPTNYLVCFQTASVQLDLERFFGVCRSFTQPFCFGIILQIIDCHTQCRLRQNQVCTFFVTPIPVGRVYR